MTSFTDREALTSDVFEVIIEARDDANHLATAQLVIIVMDENDNAPRFGESHIRASVLESVVGYHQVVQVQAVDKDEGANSDVTYAIYSGSDDVFVIDKQSGDNQVLI